MKVFWVSWCFCDGVIEKCRFGGLTSLTPRVYECWALLRTVVVLAKMLPVPRSEKGERSATTVGPISGATEGVDMVISANEACFSLFCWRAQPVKTSTADSKKTAQRTLSSVRAWFYYYDNNKQDRSEIGSSRRFSLDKRKASTTNASYNNGRCHTIKCQKKRCAMAWRHKNRCYQFFFTYPLVLPRRDDLYTWWIYPARILSGMSFHIVAFFFRSWFFELKPNSSANKASSSRSNAIPLVHDTETRNWVLASERNVYQVSYIIRGGTNCERTNLAEATVPSLAWWSTNIWVTITDRRVGTINQKLTMPNRPTDKSLNLSLVSRRVFVHWWRPRFSFIFLRAECFGGVV